MLLVLICCIIIIICETVDVWTPYPPVSKKPDWLKFKYIYLRTLNSEYKPQATMESKIEIDNTFKPTYFKPKKPNYIVLLLDVSPSMDVMNEPKNSPTDSTSRMDHLRKAVDSFLNQIPVCTTQ